MRRWISSAGDGGFVSNACVDLLFGLGSSGARALEVIWPDRERTTTRSELRDLSGGTLVVCLDERGAALDFRPAAARDVRGASR